MSDSERIARWRQEHGMRAMGPATAKTYPAPGQQRVGGALAQAGGPKVAAWDGTSHRVTLHGHDAEYGTPEAGTKTDKRGRRAGETISGEVVELCEIMIKIGKVLPDGSFMVTFGVLFELYTKISNKLVGMLMRARKHGLVKFEGEMLFQRRDDHVEIFLMTVPEQLQEMAQGRLNGEPPARVW